MLYSKRIWSIALKSALTPNFVKNVL